MLASGPAYAGCAFTKTGPNSKMRRGDAVQRNRVVIILEESHRMDK